MTEKEFHKMKSTDLVQLLLTQGKEDSLLQAGLELKKEKIESLKEHNDSLKQMLNERDALTEQLKKDLDLSDARIRRLEQEFKALQEEKWIEMEAPGSLTEAARRLNEIFEAAQREADRYLYGKRPAKENIRQFKPNRQAQQAAKEEPVPEKMILDFNGGAVYAERKPVPPRQEQEASRSGPKSASDIKSTKLQQSKTVSYNIEETQSTKPAVDEETSAKGTAVTVEETQTAKPADAEAAEAEAAVNSAAIPDVENEPYELKSDKLLKAIKGADQQLREQQSHTALSADTIQQNDMDSQPSLSEEPLIHEETENSSDTDKVSSQEETSEPSGKKQRKGLFGGLGRKRDSKKTVSRYGLILPIFARQKS